MNLRFIGGMRAMCLGFCGLICVVAGATEINPRHEQLLDDNWHSVAEETDANSHDGFERRDFDDTTWNAVDVPHNWDDYGGDHRLVHGNLHGRAWYRRTFSLDARERRRRIFLYFEGVGSYATVWVNGQLAGTHAGGRTTFTLDVTSLVKAGETNVLAVRADHPAGITDLPWVCGGCSTTPGFSEGSQPMGIFRPVHLISTNDVRVEPFGVHVWNDADATAASAKIHFTTELHNYGAARSLTLETQVIDPVGKVVQSASQRQEIGPGGSMVAGNFTLGGVALWSLESPSLYLMKTIVRDGDRIIDETETSFGIRTIHWPDPHSTADAPFLLNGKPVFINGTCEYEHLLGASHAFGDEQIRARVAQIRAAGFNAFRDAHQPHNLRYQEYWDRDGLLWWPQFAAQIWFDTPQFRANFKTLLRDWVRERRNSPSLVLWGLANESKLPPDFAAECVALIRKLDPTSPTQRLVTTCNGGKGADWNVPQNWSGTYGGKPAGYADDLLGQHLVGEYGAWRSLGLHSEGGFVVKGVRSEDRADALFETKIRLAESVRDRVAGHFHWLFASHENPGRPIGSEGQQGRDGWAELDRLGSVNNKGLLTLWGEPTDAFYLYRAAYVPGAKDPMVYIASHTWPDRWSGPGRKSDIEVYSNCDEVELFNDVRDRSLGVRRRGGPGTHFQWDEVEIDTNVLYAEGRIDGKVVATDAIVLKNLPDAPHRRELNGKTENITTPVAGQNYLYRVNCGGPDYTDVNANHWMADRDFRNGETWGSSSWAMAYPDVPSRFGSQRETADVIAGTADGPLFQTYRYGREKLRWRFAVPDGEYRVELYFTEPWYGTGGGDCTGWRLFDVGVNGKTLLRNVDLWKESGHAHAVKKVVTAQIRGGWLEISFPRVASYQAVISAIAISTTNLTAKIPTEAIVANGAVFKPRSQLKDGRGQPSQPAEMTYPVARAKRSGGELTWAIQIGLGGTHDFSIRYATPNSHAVTVELRVTATDGTPAGSRRLQLAPTASGTASLDDIGMNAGDYSVTLLFLSGSAQIESLVVK
ncbi:MAG TPA: malectin domain-containing carbohydrate-binding protein [Lacunisphaera sp.]